MCQVSQFANGDICLRVNDKARLFVIVPAVSHSIGIGCSIRQKCFPKYLMKQFENYLNPAEILSQEKKE